MSRKRPQKCCVTRRFFFKVTHCVLAFCSACAKTQSNKTTHLFLCTQLLFSSQMITTYILNSLLVVLSIYVSYTELTAARLRMNSVERISPPPA